jgi:hypothetical protein
MTEQWALFSMSGYGIHNLAVQRVHSLTKTRISWKRPNGATRWVSLSMVHGLFPTFEAADDARQASRRAYRGDDGRGTDLIAARAAINAASGYSSILKERA